MNDLISRSALINEIMGRTLLYANTVQYATAVMNVIGAAPAVDAVEVVRCKDCKNNPGLKTRTKNMVWCRKWRNEVKPTDFCIYGKRRADDA